MSKRTERTAKLPPWFDLEKYKAAPNLTAVEWGLNLTVRGRVLNALTRQDSESKEEAIKGLKAEISLITTFGALSCSQLEDEYEFAKYNFGLDGLKPGLGIVYPLPLSYAVSIYDDIKADTELRNKLAILAYKEVFRHQREGELHQGDQFWLNWYENDYEREVYDDEFGPYLCVDLGVTDDMLIEAFKNWLHSARMNTDYCDVPGKLSQNLTQKWIDSAILPYIDLKIYEALEDVDIALHAIGNAIFPPSVEIDTTEAVRKTTRRHADKALEHAHLLLRRALITESILKKTE